MTLTIGETLYSKLKDLVGNRVYPDVAPSDVEYDKTYIVYKNDSVDVEKDLSGTLRMATFGITITCFSSEKDLTTSLADSIISTLNNSKDLTNNVKLIEYKNRQAEYELDGDLWFEIINFIAYKTN